MTARTILRWTSRIALGAIGLVLVAGAATFGLTERMARKYTVPDHPIAPRTDSAGLALGARLVKVRGCVDCHGANLAGDIMIDDPMVGRLSTPNLTLGGRGAELEPRDWERAVRHAVRRDGSPLRIMPAHEFATIADDDLGAIVGYAKHAAGREGDVGTAACRFDHCRALFLAGQVQPCRPS
jgi:mono/diheme cytochrome c family protein